MIKIRLIGNDINFTLLRNGKTEIIEIKNGSYNEVSYHNVIISNNALILEGENSLAFDSIVGVYVTPKTAAEKIADILQDNSVCLVGVDAIPKGSEREILERLF